MSPKNSLWRFLKDGMIGGGVVLITSGILVLAIFPPQDSKDFLSTIDLMFFFPDSYISPMPVAILIGFISMGIGGRFFEDITSRRSLLKSIFIVVMIGGISGFILLLLLQILFGEIRYILDNLGFSAIGAGVGFMIAGLAGVIFNPTKRLFRVIIGVIASTVVASVIEILVFLSQFYI